MTKWIARAKSTLSKNRGETLVESVVSILVFSIFMLAVTTMILASLRLTAASTKSAKANQDAVNDALLGSAAGEKKDLFIKGDGLDVTIPVKLTDDMDVPQSFYPEPKEGNDP